MKNILILIFLIVLPGAGFPQSNYVRTAMPFLRIAPDARSSAMGDNGVATTPDLNSLYWNNAKLAFLGGDYGISADYTPWLSQIKSGITSLYVTGFRKLDNKQSLAIAVNYFTLGKVNYYDEIGNDIGRYNPNEFSIEIGYAKQLSDDMSLGFTGKVLHSDLASGPSSGGSTLTPSTGAAFDVGWYYEKTAGNSNRISYGVALTNIGPKLRQTTGSGGQFLPMNLRFGAQYHLESYENSFNFSVDINKLLVPTPPIYRLDPMGNTTNTILKGSDPNRSVPAAIFGSFGDAPGGFPQQIKQFTVGLGGEYDIQKKFFFRAGYHYENMSIGDMRYLTTGFGYAGPSLRLDFSYIIPAGQYNPYKNTFRITLGFNIESNYSSK